jgi:PTH1 family peptidyl-tRNA hydrolase
MYVIVGLGNPGREYEKTRHNIGFKVIDGLAKDLDIPLSRTSSRAIVGQGMLGEHKVVLAKPQTFMNLSGESVRELAQWNKVEPSHIIIIYDDMDIPVGSVKIRKTGSDGGHKGMASVISQLKTSDIPRIRVGIGRPTGNTDPADHVLTQFTREESADMDLSIILAKDAAVKMVKDGMDAAMNEYNK